MDSASTPNATESGPQLALERAKKAAGGASALARLLGHITPQAVTQWQCVPVERVLEVERVTGESRHRLRPDIYPDDGGYAGT